MTRGGAAGAAGTGSGPGPRAPRPPQPRMGRAWAALAAAGLAAVLAGCGAPGHAGAPGGGSQGLALSACMRSHGIPDFPDPQNGGFRTRESPSATTVNGVTLRESPAQFQSAQTACEKDSGGRGGGPASPRQRRAALAYAQCMRAHGIANFPDPKVTATSLQMRLPPGTDPQSPQLRAARQACQPELRGVLGGAPQGGNGG